VAISIVASFVTCLYAVIISVGYYYYGEHTKIPGKRKGKGKSEWVDVIEKCIFFVCLLGGCMFVYALIHVHMIFLFYK
jgi:hypothetical protein